MKHLLLTTIAALVLVGCGESQQSVPPAEVGPAEPIAEVPAQPSSPPAEAKPVEPIAEAKPVNPKANKALLNAVKKGDIEAAKQAITDGADLNGEGEHGRTPFEGTPLHLAVSQDRQEIIELLIAKGADVNVKDIMGVTPLDWAVKLEKTETIKLLHKHGGKSAAQDFIHIAVQLGNIEAVKKHLDVGKDVNSKGYALDNTPLDYTTKERGVFASLSKLPDDTPEVKAAKKEIADLLRKRGGKHSSIYEAAKGGDLEGLKEFLAAGVDPDEKTGFTVGQTPLYVASTKEVVELLIANGADVNIKLNLHGTPLDYTIRSKRTEIADVLRKHGGKTSDWFKAGESIHSAARAGHIEAVKQHLAKGTDVNAKKGNGWTPLCEAAKEGHKEIAELLIKEGADVNAIIFYGRNQEKTPLDLAIQHKKTETADLLRKNGGKTGEELKAEAK